MIALNDYLFSGNTVLKILHQYSSDLKRSAIESRNPIDLVHCNFLIQIIELLEHNDFLTSQSNRIKEFYKLIPAGYDDMVFLKGDLDNYYCAAVKSGDVWFVAGINSLGASRTVELDLSFLEPGTYEAVIYEDSNDGSKTIDRREETIQSGDAITTEMQESGGFVIIIK